MILNKLEQIICNRDSIVDPSALKLHFDGDCKIKSLIGGLLSCVIEIYITYTAVSKFISMVTF